MIKISNQTVHHQSATKFASVLQHIKNYQPVILPKYVLHSWCCAKKQQQQQLVIFLNMLTMLTLTQVFLTHLVGVFLKQSYPKYISDVASKILEETIIRCFVWTCYLPEIGFPVVKVETFISNFSHLSPNRFWGIFSMLLNSHPTIKWRWKNYVAISLILHHNLTGLIQRKHLV